MKVILLFANSKLPLHLPVNFLIRWLDKSKAGHFAIRVITSEFDIVYEAVAPKVRKVMPYDVWLKYYTPNHELEIPVPQSKEAEVTKWLESILGLRYGYEQIVLIGLCAIVKPFSSYLSKVILNHEKALICTELGSRFIEKFLVYKLKKSHDEIGVRDMEEIIDDLSKTEIKWQI